VRHELGDTFKYNVNGKSANSLTSCVGIGYKDKQQLLRYNKLLSLFMDNISDGCVSPFGIHKIAEVGM
jgi:hypothetical protein